MRFGRRKRVARTPLFGSLRRAVELARLADRSGCPAAELRERCEETARSRRELFRASAAAWLGLGLGWGASPASGQDEPRPPFFRRKKAAPRVAIIGAGITGLNAAYELKKAGLRARVYEAATRIGGRIITRRDLMAPGLSADLGGEFVDSNHRVVLRLVREFGLELLDLERNRKDARLREAYFFCGAHHSEAQLVEAMRPLAERMQEDVEGLESEIDYQHGARGKAGTIDRMSVAQYLDRIGANGWVRRLIDVAYVAEYGLDSDRLSALNLLSLISTDVNAERYALYGQSDERFKIKGGSQRLTDALAARLDGQVELEHRLEAIRSLGDGFRLSFAGPGGRAVEVDADFAIVTLPFSVLRRVDLRVPLPAPQARAIAELGYGTNTKVLAGVRRRVWLDQGFSGSIFSDEPYQSAFDNSRLQGSEAGGVTMFLGGAAGVAVGSGTAAEQAGRLIGGFDRAFPGTVGTLNGQFARFHWPSAPFALGSYASYLPGQVTTIAGAEGMPTGSNLILAGEHCNFDASGYMDSGAASGRRAAKTVLDRC